MSGKRASVGKDILRLVTVAMYDNPLVLYREYLQNAVDSLDSAVAAGLPKADAVISIEMDQGERNITIRDNGLGIKKSKFADAMTSIGQSEKVARKLRGLWGIGRLVGLAYCRNLVFTTKAKGEKSVSRIVWSGEKFREVLNGPAGKWQLHEAIEYISDITVTTEEAADPSFFEVQVNGVVRHGNDVLFNDKEVKSYIGQIAPVPFCSSAPFYSKIQELLSPYVDISGYRIMLKDDSDPIFRPHQKKFFQSPSRQDNFSDIDLINIENKKGEMVAVGWLLHHSYLGALKGAPEIRGIRARIGNMQIGDERIFADIFPEPRFNSWAVGEVHMLDPNVRPNGQRSGWESTPAYRDIKNKLTVSIGQVVAKQCRTNSSKRNKIRALESKLQKFDLNLDIIEEHILPEEKAEKIIRQMEGELELAQDEIFAISNPLQKKVTNRLKEVKINGHDKNLNHMSGPQQKIVKDVVGVIYDHTPDSKTARDLISEVAEYVKSSQK